MSGAQMDGVQFGELPYLEVNGWVHACAYSSDGRMFAVGAGILEFGISIYDTLSWTRTYSFAGSDVVQTMAFSPGGTMVAFGGNGSLGLWDCASGQEIFVMEGHRDIVMSVAFSPCGKHIASSGVDKIVRVWDSQTGESLFVLEGHTSWVMSVKYSPSGERLVSGGSDDTIRFWSPMTGEPGVVLNSSLDGVNSLGFSPDGRWLASGHDEGGLQLWHAESGEPGLVLHGHTKRVTGIVFSPDSRWIASSSSDETVRLWDASTGTLINTLSSHKNWVHDVVFSPDGLQIASGGRDGKVRLWDLDSVLMSSVEQQDRIGAIGKTVYSPNGQCILSVGESQTVKQWDSLTGVHVPPSIELPKPLSVEFVSYSLTGSPTVVATQDESIQLWEFQEGSPMTILEGSSTVEYVTMSPCCRWIVSAGRDGTVTLWDLDSTQQKHILIKKDGVGLIRSWHLAFSPTGYQLAVGKQRGIG
ncbi:WD40 repeat-like protein, partial [Linnemannia elongata AG-77]